jgi:hypothetical protein
MKLALDIGASKVFLSKGLANPKMQKGALRLADGVGALFLMHIAETYARRNNGGIVLQRSLKRTSARSSSPRILSRR